MRLTFTLLLLAALLALGGCQKSQQDHDHADDIHESEHSPNQALYDEVMNIHDEVMPKMNDLHKAKTSLQTRLEMPGLGENEKQDLQNKIARIDSASESMMVWMRQFNPIPDSAGEDKARAYLESELVKVKDVKENILRALKTAAAED